MENNTRESINKNAKDNKYNTYDFNKIDVYDISKARENTKKLSRPRMYDYANNVSKKINEAIKAESEKGKFEMQRIYYIKGDFWGSNDYN